MKILIVKISSSGDIIQSFDVLEYLKQKVPHATIDWVASKDSFSLVSSHPLVRKTFCFENFFQKFSITKFQKFFRDLRKIRYDVVFDLQGNCKSGGITFLARGKHKVGFDAHSISEWPNLFVTNFHYPVLEDKNIRLQYLQLVQSYFKDKTDVSSHKRLLHIDTKQKMQIRSIVSHLPKGTLKILICPSSKWKNKELTFLTLVEFLSYLHSHWKVSFLFLWGDEEEKKRAILLSEQFKKNGHVLDRLPLSVLQNLMDQLDLVIAMDSCALHLCGTVNTPSFSIFGPTSSTVYKPMGKHHFALQGECPYHRQFKKRCSILRSCVSGDCIRKFHAKEMYQSFLHWWNSLR